MTNPSRRWRRIATSALLAAGLAAGLVAAGTATHATAQVARTPRPAVVSFRASRISVPAAGGGIALTAKVKHATRCTFTAAPKLPGLPAKVSCTAGKAAHRVRLPANRTAGNITYKLGLTVKGAGGTTAGQPLTVVVREAPPGITRFAATPDGLPSGGGAAAVTATVVRAAKCSVSVTPALAGLPKTFTCAAGTKQAAVTVPVTLPGLTGGGAARYTFTLTASGPNGSAKSAATAAVWPDMTWAAPAAADTADRYLYSVSCPTATFCAATGQSGGFVTYNGKTWLAPRQIRSTAGLVDSVSCVSATFCMAVTEASAQNGQQVGGRVFTYDGKTWADLGPYGYELISVSCTTKTHCMILATVGAGLYAMPWTGGPAPVWPPVEIDPDATAGQVSCASTRFCAVADDANDAVTYDGASWAKPQPVPASTVSPLTAVSCPTAAFCTAVDGWGQVFTFDGATWSMTAGLENSGDLQAVSCTACRFCAVGDLSGNVFTYDGSSWSAIQNADPGVAEGYGFTGISCPAPSFCAAVDWRGEAVTGAAG